MPVTYAELTRNGNTYRLTGPPIFLPGHFLAVLHPALTELAARTAGTIREGAQAAFPWEPLASSWQEHTEVGPGVALIAGVSSADTVLPFVEFDVVGHMPPWGPDTPFGRWAVRNGRSAYMAAVAYASRPHPGKHAMPAVLEAAAEAFLPDLIATVEAALRS